MLPQPVFLFLVAQVDSKSIGDSPLHVLIGLLPIILVAVLIALLVRIMLRRTRAARPKKARLANWTLILAIGNICVLGQESSLRLLAIPLSILAVLLGIVALSQIRRSHGAIGPSSLGALTGRGTAITGIIIALLVGITPVLLPLTQMARERSRESSCRNKVRQIGLLCDKYKQEHGGQPPENIEELRIYPEMERLLVCPLAKDPTRPTYRVTSEGNDWLLEEIDANHEGKHCLGRPGGRIEMFDASIWQEEHEKGFQPIVAKGEKAGLCTDAMLQRAVSQGVEPHHLKGLSGRMLLLKAMSVTENAGTLGVSPSSGHLSHRFRSDEASQVQILVIHGMPGPRLLFRDLLSPKQQPRDLIAPVLFYRWPEMTLLTSGRLDLDCTTHDTPAAVWNALARAIERAVTATP